MRFWQRLNKRLFVNYALTLTVLLAFFASAVQSAPPILGSYGGSQNTGQSSFRSEINSPPVIDWEAVIDGPIVSSPVIGGDGTFYVGAGYSLQAVSPNGQVEWTYPTSQRVYTAPAIAPDGLIFVGDLSGTLYCIYPNTVFLNGRGVLVPEPSDAFLPHR